jgi:hypothetical protein
MDWPPTLTDLRLDRGLAESEIREDHQLQQVLNTAVAFVERVRPEFNYTADPLSELPEPTADLVLGTVRLAGRWHDRRRAPNGQTAMAELGRTSVPSVDPDISRLLRIGRFSPPRTA